MLPDGWPHDALPPGTILNGYCIQAILGRGGFGITYEAVDELDQRFAVKECFPRQFGYRADLEIVPNSESEADAFKDCRDRFLREARALAQLGSAGGDGVVKVVTYFRAHQTAYIVMELLDGETLEDLIKDHKGSFPKHELEGIFEKLLNVLERVHKFGLIHRDIKPNNIILKENNRPILIDFGAARASSHGQMTRLHRYFQKVMRRSNRYLHLRKARCPTSMPSAQRFTRPSAARRWTHLPGSRR
jgi:serine/threonine protein kinase